MAYIYCITNKINGKQYVGKTTYSVTKRFQEHCRDSKKDSCKKRPLYDAMNKYGVENFLVEQLLECDELELSSYEILYIDKLNTYHNGYNATRGGDGTILFDYKEIVALYNKGMFIKDVASQMQCCVDTVRKVLRLYGISTRKDNTNGKSKSKPIKQLTKDNVYLRSFPSTVQAFQWLYDNGFCKSLNIGNAYKISQCADGKLKTAYKFKWEWE